MIFCANPLAQYKTRKNEIDDAIHRVLDSGSYILGPSVEALEKEFAEYIGTSSAIAVANGTDALELSLKALGIGFGDEIITVSHTAVATVASIESVGANPILVDIDPDSYTLDCSQLAKALTIKTKAIIAVHLYGLSADMDFLVKFCRENNLFLIEDVSQAHGGKWFNKRLGSIGDIGCFSCYPTKNLGAIGDAGLITTKNDSLASKIRMLREYGWKKRYVSDIPGRNSRLDEIQAAILRVKLKYLDDDNCKRKQIANFYSNNLDNLNIKIPKNKQNADHVYHLYVIQVENREYLIKHLNKNNIFPGIHYPVPIHMQPAYRNRLFASLELPVTSEISRKVLSLPLFPELSLDEVEFITKTVNSFYG